MSQLTDLPKDILPLINDTKGYHSLICSSKLFHRLGKEIVRQKKTQYRRVIKTEEITDVQRVTVVKEVLPNGTLDGTTRKVFSLNPDFVHQQEYRDGRREGLYRKYVNDILIIQETYTNDELDGISCEWRLFPVRNLVERAVYDHGLLLLKERFNLNGHVMNRYICKDNWFLRRKILTFYSDDGSIQAVIEENALIKWWQVLRDNPSLLLLFFFMFFELGIIGYFIYYSTGQDRWTQVSTWSLTGILLYGHYSGYLSKWRNRLYSMIL